MNKFVLDVCCGSRMFWFDRQDLRAVFVDKRREQHDEGICPDACELCEAQREAGEESLGG